VSWSLRFAEPIVLPDGGELTTLREAIAHLGKIIPKCAHDMPEVQTAAELLTNAAEHGGPVELARIATLQALISSRRPRIQSRTQRVTLGTARERRKLARDP